MKFIVDIVEHFLSVGLESYKPSFLQTISGLMKELNSVYNWVKKASIHHSGVCFLVSSMYVLLVLSP